MEHNIPKELYKTPTIYIIKNNIDDRVYVGGSASLIVRFRKHKSMLKHREHSSRLLQHFYDEHGPDSLILEVLEVCTKETLIDREQYYTDLLNSAFNVRRIVHTNKGIKRTEETIRKTSIASKGRRWTLEQRKNFSEEMMARKPFLGCTHSEETRKKMSVKVKLNGPKGTKHPMSKFTPEDLQNIRQMLSERKKCVFIAKRYGVDSCTIERIKRGITYK